MQRRILPAFQCFTAVLCSSVLLAAVTNAQAPDSAGRAGLPPSIEFEQIAQRVVNQTLRVREGEMILISTGMEDVEFAEDIATHVRKAGAFPLVELNTERMEKRSFTEVPEKYDAQPPKLALTLLDVLDAMIFIDRGYTPGLLDDVPVHRRNARNRAETAVFEKVAKGDTRIVNIGNGLYPTAWRAERFGMTEPELGALFWRGLNADYTAVQSRGEQLKSLLSSGNAVRLRSADGTDLKVNVRGRPILVSDGIISDEDKKKGGAAAFVYLPAGEVYVSPEAGSANGTLAVPLMYFDGKEVQELKLSFSGGEMRSMSGSGPGFIALKAAYDGARDPGKAQFGFLDLGINDQLQLPTSTKVPTFVPAGSVTVGVGNDLEAGGTNNSEFLMYVPLRNVNMTLDGNAVIERGNLKLSRRDERAAP